MPLEIHRDSHLDHGLTSEHVAHILDIFADVDTGFTATIGLPLPLPGVDCALYGPIMGDKPVILARYAHRGERSYVSRIVSRPFRPSRLVTVIAGPHDGKPCVLYTAFGGPPAPREPGDPSLTPGARAESEAFWHEHALGDGTRPPCVPESLRYR